MTPTDSDDFERRLRDAVAERIGHAVTHVAPLVSALGTRRFARVWLAEGAPMATLIARVEAPEDPARRPTGVAPEPALEPIRAHLAEHGLPVPQRYAGGADGGVELLEDLGDRSLADVAAGASPETLRSYYTAACELAAGLQRVGPAPGVDAFRRELDESQLAYKADRFARYSLRAGRGATPGEAAVIREAFARVAREVADAPRRLSHRDFQSANLMVRGSALVMIDLQGAFLAPPEYDLMCLLRDSYVELPDDLVTELAATSRATLPDPPDADDFERRFDLLTVTRKGKDHALFRYAAVELGDARYLGYLPATTRYLKAGVSRAARRDPAFAALADIVQALDEDAPGGPTCER